MWTYSSVDIAGTHISRTDRIKIYLSECVISSEPALPDIFYYNISVPFNTIFEPECFATAEENRKVAFNIPLRAFPRNFPA
ncbi:hypothetical protein B5X24_HaOG212092 [Helicoverpa armigera]|uniref:ZP domain-containing protein n=1 Tax=Helicoverpa armigera TaxID=29058 RepID=A0A2W1BDQ6_HELAM|nr:hypothetical protein B5X24_HaOG212092 [Helicoverpa armigera]